mgnify:CR=1 FL=1
MPFDVNEVEINEWDGIDHSDHPDYVDAFPSSVTYNGEEMSEQQINDLCEEHPDWVYNELIGHIF